MIKNKKIIIPIILIVILTIAIYLVNKSRNISSPSSFFQNTIPLFYKQPNDSKNVADEIIYPPINPIQTNYKNITVQTTNELSEIEKDKIASDLPIYIDNFTTGSKINTTINIYELVSDPPTSIRIEIYGPNYNNTGQLSEDAKAFKASFQEVRKILKAKKINLNNLQIIYGNRQYIQDTATIWVKDFGLLN